MQLPVKDDCIIFLTLITKKPSLANVELYILISEIKLVKGLAMYINDTSIFGFPCFYPGICIFNPYPHMCNL